MLEAGGGTMANENLTQAKRAKKDEFYTQYVDIEREINAYLDFDPHVFRDKTILLPCDDPEWSNFTHYFAANFDRFGIRKLISTSYAPSRRMDLFSEAKPTVEQDHERGKLFVLDRDRNQDGRIDIQDLDWSYLDGDGDFRSAEVTALRDEADIVITNPPFSLFREYIGWVMKGEKLFVAIGHQNAITYKDVFGYIKEGRIWLGKGFKGGAGFFINKHYEDYATATAREEGMIRVSGVTWFTNIDHGRRHEPLQLMSMKENLRWHKRMKTQKVYNQYENYDAIEVPFTDAIPKDYDGVMGVPITFLDKYCPKQFEIVGTTESNDPENPLRTRWYTSQECRNAYEARFGNTGVYDLNASGIVDGVKVFKRVLIRHRIAQ